MSERIVLDRMGEMDVCRMGTRADSSFPEELGINDFISGLV